MTPDQLAQEAKRPPCALSFQQVKSAMDVAARNGLVRSRGLSLDEYLNNWATIQMMVEACLAHWPVDANLAHIAELTKRAESAEALVEQYRKDAERYRWLRDAAENGVNWDQLCPADNHVSLVVPIGPYDADFTLRWASNIDAAIDAARRSHD